MIKIVKNNLETKFAHSLNLQLLFSKLTTSEGSFKHTTSNSGIKFSSIFSNKLLNFSWNTGLWSSLIWL